MQSSNYFELIRKHSRSTLNPWKLRRLIDEVINYVEEQERHRHRVAVTELMQAVEDLKILPLPNGEVL